MTHVPRRRETQEPAGESWDELEDAYQRALSALDALETAGAALAADPSADGESEARLQRDAAHCRSIAPAGDPASTAIRAEGNDAERVTPRQILEALLFVGGQPLTSRRMSSVLRDEFPPEFIDRTIAELNVQYAQQQRPYEIALEEEGYRMRLRAEHSASRNRVFGLAPKEVKLSQEALEILALVAYRQPITREQVQASGKAQAGAVLNQLLRRELVSLERNPGDGRDIAYRTTPRFLQIFGLHDLEELPLPEDLSFK